MPGDITNPRDLDRLYATVRDRGHGLDVLVANAASASFGTIEDTSAEEVERTFAVNVTGTFMTVQKAIPLLNEGASVVITTSTTATRGVEGLGAYSASKAALRSFARTWANELRGRGIRVNAVSPGTTDTSGVTELVGEENVVGYDAELGARNPIGRVATPDEIAAVATFLASPDSSFMLGAAIEVDGGANQI